MIIITTEEVGSASEISVCMFAVFYYFEKCNAGTGAVATGETF